ncbi:MAG: CotH kinase family protein [Gemmataceae bacterium]
MNRLLALAAIFAGPCSAFGQDEVFRIDKMWPIHIEMTAKEYDAMQPPPNMGGGFGFGPPMPPPKQPEKKPGEREVHRSVFGTDFPVAHATIRSGDQTANHVAIRYKGNSTYLAAARGLKRSMKIDVNEFEPSQKFLGVKTLNLHSGVHDPSKVREAVTYEIFRAVGVPAPRTAFAEVTLTVPGKYDKELVGFYTLTEPVNKPFLVRHYKTDKGLLMKPERIRGLDYLGDTWEPLKAAYQPKRDATKDEQDRVLAFLKLVNRSSAAEFEKRIGEFLDIDAFLKFLAVHSLTANLDCFFTNGHNFYLYLHPETKKFHFIPWDTDLSLGNFAFFGTPEQQMDLSITKPYVECKLADKLMAMPEVKVKYMSIVKELATTAMNAERVMKVVASVESVAAPAMKRDEAAAKSRREPGAFPAFGAKPPELKAFFEKRAESIAAQLAGKSKGYEPKMPAFGGFGPPPPAGGFGPGAQLAKPLLDAIDANRDGKATEEEFTAAMKRLFTEWDTNKDGSLSQQEIAAGLQKLNQKK